MARKLKILYAAGPGNVIGTFHYWCQGQDDPSRLAVTFSGQFYDVCTDCDAEGYLISSNADKRHWQQGRFTFENRPVPLTQQSGVLYYLGQIYYELGIVLSALKFNADLVIAANTDCFFISSLLPRLGIQVVPSLHCVLWPKYKPLSQAQKLLWRLNRRLFAQDCLAILSTSEDINQQLHQLTGGQAQPIINFLSTYRRQEFADVPPPNPDRAPFHVLFAARIERDKGVFDVLALAQRFRAAGHTHIIFHICGEGTALADLKHQVEAADLQSTFILYGYCNKPEMREMLGLAHVVLVPTQSGFTEGLNQVVVEGILAHRPVITSAICPALHYVREAVVEVPPDDVSAYGDAILELQTNTKLYEAKQRNCQVLQEQFYRESTSWAAALKQVIQMLESGDRPAQSQQLQTSNSR